MDDDFTSGPNGAPPNIPVYLANGFNAKLFDFAGAPIFGPLTYENKQQITYGVLQATYDVPDGFQADGVAAFYTTTTRKVVENQSDFEQSFSLGLSASGEVRRAAVKVSAGVSSKLKMAGKLFHSLNQEYVHSFAIQTVCQVERLLVNGVPKLGPCADFEAAATALPEKPATEADWGKYFRFFDTYGTHFLLRGSMGGYFLTETRINKALVQSRASAEIAAAIEAGINVTVAAGSFKADSSYGQNKFLSDMAEGMETRYECRGGLFSTEVRPWVLSCFRNPILLPGINGLCEPLLAPISDIVPETRRVNVQKALRVYLSDHRILGESVAVPLNASYVAAESGLLGVTVRAGVNAAGTATMQMSPLPPKMRPLQICVHNETSRKALVPRLSIMQPVRGKQDTCIPTLQQSQGVVDGRAVFMPVENVWSPGACFAETIVFDTLQPEKGKSKTATLSSATDMLLLGTAAWGSKNGGRGYLIVKDDAGRMLGGCSAHSEDDDQPQFTQYSAFAMPLQAKKQYEIYAKTDDGNANFTYSTTAFINGIKLGDRLTFDPAITYFAETDGLLVASLWYQPEDKPDADKFATLSLVSGFNRADLVVRESTPATSVAAGTWIFYNTVMLPVRRDSYFEAKLDFNTRGGRPDVCVSWFPLMASDLAAS